MTNQETKFRTSLETSRLSLTLYNLTTNDDAQWMYRFLTDPRVVAMLNLKSIVNMETLKTIEKVWALGPDIANGYTGLCVYMVRLKDTKDVIGVVSYKHKRTDPDFGYGILPEYWGNGYATEASAEVLRYLTEEVGLSSLLAHTDAGHHNSQRVLKKLGFVRDPELDFVEGSGCDKVSVEMFQFMHQ
ncbi:GNAT domain-containing protein [Tricladium varicosporioides]|nr:GNAT domain-containing protein [Hymenoscyphus varicosporioides]